MPTAERLGLAQREQAAKAQDHKSESSSFVSKGGHCKAAPFLLSRFLLRWQFVALLITGGSGLLGSAIVDAAHALGRDVRTVDLRSSDSSFRGGSVVIHAAGLAHVFGARARDVDAFERANVTLTRRVVEAARGENVKRVMLISSVSVYGPHGNESVNEDHLCNPIGPYGESKLRAERAATEIAGSALALTILRMPTLYGEGDRGNIARLIRAIRRHTFVQIGHGSNRKTLMHRDDAASACLAAADSALSGVFNVPAGIHTMAEIVGTIATTLRTRVPRLPISDAMLETLSRRSSTLAKFVSDDAYDGSRFAAATRFAPRISLEEGIRRQIAAAL
jgi:nucleoside-diphosphate-sugar epimerase